MSKKEMIKEDIATYRTILLLLATSLFGIIGYSIINIEKLSQIQINLGSIVSFILFLGFIYFVKKYLKARKILEKM